jgi:N-acetylmuramoyl-L-alanine amidase/lipopolysaccharide export system protein LptA
MEWFNYLLKVSACSALFFAFYILVLRKLTFFKINRFYLLGSLVLSFIIPALQFTIEREVAQSTVIEQPTVLQDVDLGGAAFTTPIVIGTGTGDVEVEPFDWYGLLPYVYTAIVMGLLTAAAWRLFQLYKHTRAKAHEVNGLKLVAKNVGFTNCSFFNYVFIDQNSLTETELQVLLRHEQVHAKQLHSIDKILLMLAKAVLWFNPIIYLYDKALEQTHEYEADEATSLNVGTEHYASLLLKLAVSKNTMPLIHNFVKSPIKERIKMLFNSKSKNMKKLMYLLALPIGLGLLWGFTVDVVDVFPKSANGNEFTLILDAGHGGKESGAEMNGYKEKDIALAFTKKIKALAESKGIKVVTTRTSDESLSLADRLKPQGDFLLSIHVNSEPIKTSGVRNGIEMYTPTSDKKLNWFKSTSMTYDLYKNLKTVEGIKTGNKPFQKKLFLLQNSSAAGLVLEMGYLTNKQDFKAITNEAKQNELAEAIVNGILHYKENLRTDEEIESNMKGASLQSPPKPNQQNVPFIQRTKTNYNDGFKGEYIVITANPKTIRKIYTTTVGQTKLYFYINQKLYSEAEAMKFTPEFIAQLSSKSGIGNTKNSYVVPGVENSDNNYVVWFGIEPQLSASMVKNRSIYQKYNGKTIDGNIIAYTYSPVSKVMDGFIVKTTNGETLKANVEEKFAKQTQAMIAKGDKISIKIYNANYSEKTEFPLVTSYKLMKDDKVLFDRWPKTASNKIMVNDNAVNVLQTKTAIKPKLISASTLTVDTKNKINYVVDGKYNIGGVLLEAKESIFDNTRNTIKAIKATITKNGHMIVSDEIVVDVNANYFTVKEIKEPFRLSTFSKVDQGYLDVGYAKKVKYDARDSVNVNKRDEIITLYGNATIANEKMKFKGSEITYNGKLNKATIKDATYYEEGNTVTSDLMEVDFNTSKVISKKGVLKLTWK